VTQLCVWKSLLKVEPIPVERFFLFEKTNRLYVLNFNISNISNYLSTTNTIPSTSWIKFNSRNFVSTVDALRPLKNVNIESSYISTLNTLPGVNFIKTSSRNYSDSVSCLIPDVKNKNLDNTYFLSTVNPSPSLKFSISYIFNMYEEFNLSLMKVKALPPSYSINLTFSICPTR